jgi:hypothetical protein
MIWTIRAGSLSDPDRGFFDLSLNEKPQLRHARCAIQGALFLTVRLTSVTLVFARAELRVLKWLVREPTRKKGNFSLSFRDRAFGSRAFCILRL